MNLNINQIILGGFLIRFGFAFYGGFLGNMIGGDSDALSFHFRAANIWYNNGMEHYNSMFRSDSFILDGTNLYIYILELIYKITIPHLFIGCLFSCFVWFYSAKTLSKVCYLLKVTTLNHKKILFIYSIWPSSIIFCSLTLREPLQLLCVNLFILLFLKIYYLKINIIKNFLLILLISHLLSSLHYSFLFSCLLMISLLIFLFLYEKTKSKISLLFLTAAGSIIFFYAFNNVFNIFYDFEIHEQIKIFNEGSFGNYQRAGYRSIVNIDSFYDIFIFIPYAFFQYLVEPLPLRISTILDLLLFFENIFRIFILAKGVYSLKKNYFYSPLFFTIIYFLIIEMIWSIGTTNWGTAARHHVTAIGILCLLGFMLPNIKLHQNTNYFK